MGPALNMAASVGAYVLADRGTWLNFKNRADLAVLVEGDKQLFNQYGVMVVNPAKHPHVKAADAQKFVDWVVSPSGQNVIAGYKIGGEQLFFPNADEVRPRHALAWQRLRHWPWRRWVWRVAAARARRRWPLRRPALPVVVYAAGSLREVLTAIAAEHEARTGQKIALTFGASGLLRERIEKGEPAQVFASADTDHPQRLATQGGWQTPVVFTRNALCALTSDQINATPATLLATLLQPNVRVGISTPKADPAGDYAWALFGKADAVQPGATARLQAKALKLTGGADSPKAPPGRGTYAWVMDQGQADVFLTYCTNAVSAQKKCRA